MTQCSSTQAHSTSARISLWLQLLIQHMGSWKDTQFLIWNKTDANKAILRDAQVPLVPFWMLKYYISTAWRNKSRDSCHMEENSRFLSPALPSGLSQMQILSPCCWPLPPQLAHCLMASLGQDVFPRVGLGPLKQLATPCSRGASKPHI